MSFRYELEGRAADAASKRELERSWQALATFL
jgi:hypothetical protein